MNDALLLEMLKATTLALRVALGHAEVSYVSTARTMAGEVITDERYRSLTPTQRAAMADADTAITDTASAVKGLKPR